MNSEYINGLWNSKWIQRFGEISLLLIMAVMLLFFYWLFYPYKVMDVSSTRLITNEVYAGNIVLWKMDYCNYVNQPSIVVHQISNDVVIYEAPKRAMLPLGCMNGSIIAVEIPNYAPTGRYHISTMMKYNINPLRDVIIEYDTEEFDVINTEL